MVDSLPIPHSLLLGVNPLVQSLVLENHCSVHIPSIQNEELIPFVVLLQITLLFQILHIPDFIADSAPPIRSLNVDALLVGQVVYSPHESLRGFQDSGLFKQRYKRRRKSGRLQCSTWQLGGSEAPHRPRGERSNWRRLLFARRNSSPDK